MTNKKPEDSKIWGTIVSEIDTLDNHIENIRDNFSGKYSMSNEAFAQRSADFLLAKFGTSKVHCDIGASIAALSEKLNSAGWNSYAIDGCAHGFKNNIIKIPKSKYAVCDFRKDISPLSLEKSFDIMTAFEVTEHIPKDDIESFLSNVKNSSDIFVCSIHFDGGEHGSHYNVKPTEWWMDLLSKYGKVTKLDDLKQLFLSFEHSDFVMVEFFG